MKITAQSSGLQEARKGFQAIYARAQDKKQIHTIAGHYMVATGVPQVFRAAGPGWAPLKIRRGGKPLNDTGRLRASVAYQATEADVVIGSPLIYAGVHQYGATIRAKNAPYLVFGTSFKGRYKATSYARVKSVVIPQRKFLFWTPANLAAIAKRVELFVATGKGAAA